MTERDELLLRLAGKFVKKRITSAFMVGFSVIYLGGFGLLWWQTSWKVTLAVFLISYGVLLQGHLSFVERDEVC